MVSGQLEVLVNSVNKTIGSGEIGTTSLRYTERVFIITTESFWKTRDLLGRESRGPPRLPVDQGQSPGRGSRGVKLPGPKTNLCVFTCLKKALHESRLFIFIIQKSCQIL